MNTKKFPCAFLKLQSLGCINAPDVINTQDGFWMIYKSLSDILAERGILDCPDSDGTRFECNKFFDDWFLYAVSNECDCTYSLVKLREQEYDAKEKISADGDEPGVTVSFVPFDSEVLVNCLSEPTDENRRLLECEINRTVARKGENHHENLKRYFVNPKSCGAYLIADMYVRYIASLSEIGFADVPERFRENARKSKSRLTKFIESLNKTAGYIVCDNEKIYIKNKEEPNEYERAAILATHTGNTSEYSFAAEVEYHARFLTSWAKIKIPFLRRSLYDSAIRADMAADDNRLMGLAPFYRENSKAVKRQRALHGRKPTLKEGDK